MVVRCVCVCGVAVVCTAPGISDDGGCRGNFVGAKAGVGVGAVVGGGVTCEQ